jgi:Ni/Co efflux regulator RcnB
MIKKAVLAAIALSFVGAPLAQAQDYHQPRKPGYNRVEPTRPSHGKEFQRYDRRDHGHKRWSRAVIRKSATTSVMACANQVAVSIG